MGNLNQLEIKLSDALQSRIIDAITDHASHLSDDALAYYVGIVFENVSKHGMDAVLDETIKGCVDVLLMSSKLRFDNNFALLEKEVILSLGFDDISELSDDVKAELPCYHTMQKNEKIATMGGDEICILARKLAMEIK